MHRGILVVGLLALSGGTAAQQVYKCVERGKPDSYQSHPCANGAPVKAWDAVPDRDNPYLRARLAQMEREVAARRAAQRPVVAGIGGGSRGGGVHIPSTNGGGAVHTSSSYACEGAKRQRAAVYDAAGHRRSFALSRSMDDAVYNACK